MTNEKNQKRMIRALFGETCDRPPFWFMRQAGRYLPEYRELRKQAPNFLDFCYTPDHAVEVTLQPIRRYGMDAAILFSDILVIPDALGQKVEFREGEGPVLQPIRKADDIAALRLDRVGTHLAPVFETLRRLSDELDTETALIGFAGAPWTVAVYMVEGRGGTDHGVIKSWARERPAEFRSLIDVLVRATTDYLCRQVESGAEVLMLFDSWAGVWAGVEFDTWISEPNRRIIAAVTEKHPHIPFIGFPRQSGQRARNFAASTGVRGIAIDETVTQEWARDNLQSRWCVQGNLSNRLLVEGGDELLTAVDRGLDLLGHGPYIFNLGHGVVPETPPEHVAMVSERIKSWRSHPA